MRSSGYLILETTFKLYAFTSSPFQLALLNLFTRLDYRLPNMVFLRLDVCQSRCVWVSILALLLLLFQCSSVARLTLLVAPPSRLHQTRPLELAHLGTVVCLQVVGIITKDSVASAFSHGITSKEVAS